MPPPLNPSPTCFASGGGKIFRVIVASQAELEREVFFTTQALPEEEREFFSCWKQASRVWVNFTYIDQQSLQKIVIRNSSPRINLLREED